MYIGNEIKKSKCKDKKLKKIREYYDGKTPDHMRVKDDFFREP